MPGQRHGLQSCMRLLHPWYPACSIQSDSSQVQLLNLHFITGPFLTSLHSSCTLIALYLNKCANKLKDSLKLLPRVGWDAHTGTRIHPHLLGRPRCSLGVTKHSSAVPRAPMVAAPIADCSHKTTLSVLGHGQNSTGQPYCIRHQIRCIWCIYG